MNPTTDVQPIEDDPHHHSEEARKAAQKLEGYFQALTKLGASDLHLKAGRSPHIRLKSVVKPTKSPELSSEEIEAMGMSLLSPKQREYFLTHGSIDIAHQVVGGDRYRINIFRQRGDVSMAARRVTSDIPSFEQLHLPNVLAEVAREHQGLVLLSGPTGSGKSTSIAAMIDHINSTRSCHIVTIEDPIEYLYEDKKALVSQREVGIDVESFEAALKYLLREDPDVVLIGEMRDRDTFEAALQASETGHLVFGTVHASTAPQTIERVLALFPEGSRELVRQSFAFNLKGIICQKLLPSIAEGIDRVPALEIMLMNPSVRQLIEDGRESEILDVVRSNENQGMQTFTKSLLDLIESEMIDPRVGYEVASNPDELKMRLKGISTGHSGLLG
ncbi:MAG: type IV pilus twitching motility protein PilT [Phycisphaerae bacterium]